jgi:hypothetical protein
LPAIREGEKYCGQFSATILAGALALSEKELTRLVIQTETKM